MKLNTKQILDIRLLYATGAIQTEIARRFRVSQFTISRVLNDKYTLARKQKSA